MRHATTVVALSLLIGCTGGAADRTGDTSPPPPATPIATATPTTPPTPPATPDPTPTAEPTPTLPPCGEVLWTALDGWSAEGGNPAALLRANTGGLRSLRNVSEADDVAAVLRLPGPPSERRGRVRHLDEVTVIAERRAEGAAMAVSILFLDDDGEAVELAAWPLPAYPIGEPVVGTLRIDDYPDGGELYGRVWWDNAGVSQAAGLVSLRGVFCDR